MTTGDPIKSAARCIAILEFFAEADRSATVGEVARRLGMPQSSASMLLGSLVSLGYLRRDAASRRYQATLRVPLLGRLAAGEVSIVSGLVTGMEEMRVRTRGSVMLGMRQGVLVRYIVALRGDNTKSEHYVLGALRPVFRVAPGKILLAQEPDAFIGRLLRRANAEEDPARRLRLADVMAEIARIRAEGWAESPGGATPGTSLTSVMLPVPAGQAALSLTLGVPRAEAEARRDAIIRDLRVLAASVTG
ncbi:MAG TPA: helix-turn-helix domain-containing protein [Roseomonas sp.]|jgi:DNA-binding IclR family transcriptional regulator